MHASRTPSAIGDGDEAPDLTPESARALYFIRGRVRLNAGRRPRTLATAVTTGSWPRDRSLGAGPRMIGGCPNRARGARSRTRVNGATIPPESVAESPAKSARCRTSVVSSRARASPPVTNGHERLTAPGTPWEWSGTPEADQKTSGPTPLEAACLSPCRGNGRRAEIPLMVTCGRQGGRMIPPASSALPLLSSIRGPASRSTSH